MIDSENMRAVNVKMKFIWIMSKLTYFPQKRLTKQKKIIQIDLYLTFWRYSNRNLKDNEISSFSHKYSNFTELPLKTLTLLYIKNITNSVWFNRYFETLSKFSKCAMKSFPTWTLCLNLLHNKCLIPKKCVQWTYKWNSFG